MHCTMFAVTAETWVTFDTRLWWCFSKAAAHHNTEKPRKCLSCYQVLFICPWEAEAAQESGVGGWCHTLCAVSELTHSYWLWHGTYMKPCSAAAAWGTAQVMQKLHFFFPLPVRPTKRHKSLSEPPDFRVSTLPLKEEEKKVWNKTEKNPVPVLTWTLITTGRTPASPYYSV